MDDIFDLTIVGGAPAGLYASYYAGFRAMKVKLIDSLEELGGQVTALYPEKFIFDVAGFPKVYGKDLIKNLVDQAMQYQPTVSLAQRVVAGKATPDKHYELTTEKGVTTLTKAILITIGIGAFNPKRIPAPGATQ